MIAFYINGMDASFGSQGNIVVLSIKLAEIEPMDSLLTSLQYSCLTMLWANDNTRQLNY